MTLDPTIVAIRAGLAPFRRRLWLRRIVRDATWVVAILVGLELLLALAARVAPLGWAGSVALAIPVVGLVALLIDAVRVRPTLAETALALDGEQGLRDRISSALEIADRSPEVSGAEDSGEAVGEAGTATADDGRATESATYADFVRLQRRDALSRLRAADHRAFRPRLPRRPARIAAILALLLIPALVLPNPQADDARAAGTPARGRGAQAERLERTADRLDGGAHHADDPRADLAEELRRLSRELRERPEDLESQLARLGSLEDALRARLDPSNEQRAAALASLARRVSAPPVRQRQQPGRRPAEGRRGRSTGSAERCRRDDGRRAASAWRRQLAELEGVARQAGAGAQARAARRRARRIARGDDAGAQDALGRLGEALDQGGPRTSSCSATWRGPPATSRRRAGR